MLRSYKTEIKPSTEQREKINRTIGTCRFIYNFFIKHNKEQYLQTKKFVTGYDFSKYLNNEFIPNNPDFKWIKEVSSKAVKQSIMNAEQSFKNFFKTKKGFPKFKKKHNSIVKVYLPKNSDTDLLVERHRVKVPTFGWINLKEKGYIPVDKLVKSCRIEKKANRYFISVLVETGVEINSSSNSLKGIGIDLGLKTFVTVSNGETFPNINKTREVKKLERRIKSDQRKLSRKLKNKKKGESTKNIDKQRLRLQIAHQKLTNKRHDYLNKVVRSLAITKPAFITIEDLNVSGMMKNRHLSRSIASMNFSRFRNLLTQRSKVNSFELRIADRFFPSSKKCCQCGNIKKALSLAERIYVCEICGNEIDRDLNAAKNLEKLEVYRVA